MFNRDRLRDGIGKCCKDPLERFGFADHERRVPMDPGSRSRRLLMTTMAVLPS
jgi:hypothetical protein